MMRFVANFKNVIGLFIILIFLLTNISLGEKSNKHTTHLDNAYCNDLFVYTYQSAPRDLDIYFKNIKNKLDENGIIMYNYGESHGAGWQYTPMQSFLFSLSSYRKYCDTGDNQALENVTIHADWFLDTIDYTRGYASWNYHFAIERYNLDFGWSSALGNAGAIISLIQGHSINGNDAYLDAIQSTIQGLTLNLEDGGFKVEMPNGGYFYEEYPNRNEANHVLNGHLFVVLALIHYKNYYPEAKVDDLIEQGMLAVKNYMHDFDNIDTTYYSLKAKEEDRYALPQAYWQFMHTYGLDAIGNYMKDQEMLDLSKKWKGYIKENIKRQ